MIRTAPGNLSEERSERTGVRETLARVRSFAVLGLLCLAGPGFAQNVKPVGGTAQSIWFNYFGDQPVTDHLSVHLEGSYRRTLGLRQFEQYMFRSGATVVENPHWQSLIAYTYLLAAPTDGGAFGPAPIAGSLPEHRLLEQQIFEHRLAGEGKRAATLTHRFRLEQRWLGTETLGRGVANWNFGERARYRMTFHIPVGRGSDPRHYIAAFNEVYTLFGPHGGPSPFYSDYTYAALGTRTGRFFAVEVGYQYRRMEQPAGTTGIDDHQVQIYLLSTLPFRRGTHQGLE